MLNLLFISFDTLNQKISILWSYLFLKHFLTSCWLSLKLKFNQIVSGSIYDKLSLYNVLSDFINKLLTLVKFQTNNNSIRVLNIT